MELSRRDFLFGLTTSLVFPSCANAFIEPRHLVAGFNDRAMNRPHGQGPLAPNPPTQVPLPSTWRLERDGFFLDGFASFSLEAVVLSRRDYREGPLGHLVPMDLALGWGSVSRRDWFDKLHVSQYGRVYRWSYARGTGLVARDVEVSSANMHLVPATPDILDELRKIGRGEVVRLSGTLVDISNKTGLSWKSSRTREDTGLGACEIIFVERVEIK